MNQIKEHDGFTLLEVIIVLLIVGILLKQFLTPFGSQMEQHKRVATAALLNKILGATVGYAIANRRLPCPAGIDSDGQQRDQCLGDQAFGYVPAVTLGISGPIDKQGRLLDAWHRPIHYVVSTSDHATRGSPGMADFLTPGEMGNVGLTYLEPELVICREVTSSACSRTNLRANQIPVLVLSLGANDSTHGQQQHNQIPGPLFVAREFSSVSGSEFDDIVQWISENELYYQLVLADSV